MNRGGNIIMNAYDHLAIEKKWQQYWEKNQTFHCELVSKKPKYYVLDMFPYPSGAGLHVGHPEGYTATDIVARMKRMQGYNVLHPMGFDAFGLPAEQYALKTGHDAGDFTHNNIEIFKRQLKSLGMSFDWERELETCDPKYYKWTQWIFTKLYEKGLADVEDIEVNWCEGLKTVLANEEVINVDGQMVSDIGKFPVVKKPMKQWVLKITKYADRLVEDLDLLDWPEAVKTMQRNWIGRSVGADVTFQVAGTDKSFTVFTTRCDTLYGATYCVLAPELPLVGEITTDEARPAVEAYIARAKAKSDLDRTDLNKEKTGVATGAYAINPVNGKKIPIWISDYVLASYGTGAIMAVPAHDERDYAFAKAFNLPIIPVLAGGDVTKEAFVGDGVHINSGFLDGLDKKDAIEAMLSWLQAQGCGHEQVSYKLRDWIFSRQRYWGEPFPVIFWDDGTVEVLPLSELPLELPKMDHVRLSDNGESPLANAKDWVNVVRADGVHGHRETNTMPQWAGSCWYYIGYLMRDGSDFLPLSEKKVQDLVNPWLPVDLYIGGTEHAVLHLLYARFWHKVLYDCGIVTSKEPFHKLFNQGMILGEDGDKMSKSKGNVINPDDIVTKYGADTLRMYEMFMGPLEATKPWSTKSVEGPHKFLARVWRFYTEVAQLVPANPELEKSYHKMVKKVTEDYTALRFNTAISAMMVFMNDAYKDPRITTECLEGFLKVLNPVAPHLTEELWQTVCHHDKTIAYESWPSFDEAAVTAQTVTLVLQVNGKLKDRLTIPAGLDREETAKRAEESEKVKKLLSGRTLKKVIVVPDKIVNFVVTD